MKQINMFGVAMDPLDENKKYTSKIEAPVYHPKPHPVHLIELVDKSKTHRLMREIDASSLSYEEKNFLIDAAKRHNVFHYERIADYYAQASAEMQRLMERSGLVIIDFEKAIEYGFVNLCEDIRSQFMSEYGE